MFLKSVFFFFGAVAIATGPQQSICIQAAMKGENIVYTPKYHIPTVIRGGDERSFVPEPQDEMTFSDNTLYDVIVVGGGLAGLTAGVYLTDAGKTILILEKENSLGGLAAGGTRNGFSYARGAAYFSPPSKDQFKIFQHIGLGDFKTQFHIREPIDSYLLNGELYPDPWEEPSLSELPKSFALFKHALEKVLPQVAFQPVEDSKLLQWDFMNAAQWIRWLPSYVASLEDRKSKRLYAEFRQDNRLNHLDPMKEVIQFVDLYCRSALGRHTDQVSATAFANFYVSEITARYTGEWGSGDIAKRMAEILRERQPLAQVSLGSGVHKIFPKEDRVEVHFLKNGVSLKAFARKLVFAGPLGMAPKLIPEFSKLAPLQTEILKGLEYAHYSVHNVFVEGHPWRDSYDLWIRDKAYTESDPTDIILGRWQDRRIDGYEEMRDFENHPEDDMGIMTVYHPLPKSAVGKGYTDEQVLAEAESAVMRAVNMMAPLLKARWGTELKVRMVETNRWPYSIHVVKPGWFGQAAMLTKPVGPIYFANNNMGLPSVEEALYRGKRAAEEIIEKFMEERGKSDIPQAR